MIFVFNRCRNLEATANYLLQPTDWKGAERAEIAVGGSHEVSEFLRRGELINNGSSVADHVVINDKSNPDIARSNVNLRIASNALKRFVGAGLQVSPTTLWVRHKDSDGTWHEHALFLRKLFFPDRQFSAFKNDHDRILLRLLQTQLNVRLGMPDPYDPAFLRSLVPAPRRLSGPALTEFINLQQLLMGGLKSGSVRSNRDALQYLAANRELKFSVRHHCLYWEDYRLTTMSFGEIRPQPLPPGALRGWYTPADRQLLQDGLKYREMRNSDQFVLGPGRLRFPEIENPYFRLVAERFNEQEYEERILPGNPNYQPPLDDLLIRFNAIRENRSRARKIRELREFLKQLELDLFKRLEAWIARARALHFDTRINHVRDAARVVAQPVSPASFTTDSSIAPRASQANSGAARPDRPASAPAHGRRQGSSIEPIL